MTEMAAEEIKKQVMREVLDALGGDAYNRQLVEMKDILEMAHTLESRARDQALTQMKSVASVIIAYASGRSDFIGNSDVEVAVKLLREKNRSHLDAEGEANAALAASRAEMEALRVLDLVHDPFSMPALIAYAAACKPTHPELAADLTALAAACKPTHPELTADLTALATPTVSPCSEVETIARVCHEANRAWCLSAGDVSHQSWDDLSQALKDTTMRGVENIMRDPTVTPEQSHESWLRDKQSQGYVYGPVKDNEKKTHPCMVPYSELPAHDRKKDEIFRAIVLAMVDSHSPVVQSSGKRERVVQRHDTDCAVACLAMASGMTYDEALSLINPDDYREVTEKGTNDALFDRLASQLGLARDKDYQKLVFSPGWGAMIATRNLLWGRQAILNVHSLNKVEGKHFVFFDGEHIIDPSNKITRDPDIDKLPELYTFYIFSEVEGRKYIPQQGV